MSKRRIHSPYLLTRLPSSDLPVNRSMYRNNFSFKCHRRDQSPALKDQSLVFAVNDINFHPIHGTFSTCGKAYFSPSPDSLLNIAPPHDRMRPSTFGTMPRAQAQKLLDFSLTLSC